jgi:hypothetical protein
MDLNERRQCEEELIRNYYHELTNNCGVKDFTWEDCWKEYRVGGLERWLWFLVYFLGQEGPLLECEQFFHNQIAAFLHDPKMGPNDVIQPFEDPVLLFEPDRFGFGRSQVAGLGQGPRSPTWEVGVRAPLRAAKD